MASIQTFIQANSMEEVVEILQSDRSAAIIGGGAYLRLGKKRISKAINIQKLGLNAIEKTQEGYRIGAMVTYGDLERMPGNVFDGFRRAVRDNVGVQLRNMVTVGATVFSRYGFSDLNTMMMALGATVEFAQMGTMPIEDYFSMERPMRDFLIAVNIPGDVEVTAFHALRLTTTDYAILNVAAVQRDGRWRVAVGGRPGRACLCMEAAEQLENGHIYQAATALAEKLTFGTNRLAREDYRKCIAPGVLRRALEEVGVHGG